MKDFFAYFAGSGFSITMVILVMAVVVLFLFLMMYIPVLTRRILPNFGYARYSQYLPFQTVYTDNSIELTNGALIRVYRVAGIQTGMQDEKTREKFLELRTQLFNQIRDPNVILRFFMVRDAADENTDYEFDQPVLQQIYNKWRSQGLKIFLNNYYIVLEVGGNNAREKLNQYSSYIESVLAPYRPSVLKNTSRDNMSRFFGRILSPVTKPEPEVCDNNIVRAVTVDDVDFMSGGIVRYASGSEQSFAAMLSFKV